MLTTITINDRLADRIGALAGRRLANQWRPSWNAYSKGWSTPDIELRDGIPVFSGMPIPMRWS